MIAVATRIEALQAIADAARDGGARIFVGNGLNSRVFCAIADGPELFLTIGAMGTAPAIAAGFSSASGLPLVAVEGDGNALMGLSSWPAVAAAARGPFVHVVLDNGLYETTGNQPTLAERVDFVRLAEATGYAAAQEVTLDTIGAAIAEGLEADGPAFLYLPTALAERDYPRVPHHPREIYSRFRLAA